MTATHQIPEAESDSEIAPVESDSEITPVQPSKFTTNLYVNVHDISQRCQFPVLSPSRDGSDG